MLMAHNCSVTNFYNSQPHHQHQQHHRHFSVDSNKQNSFSSLHFNYNNSSNNNNNTNNSSNVSLDNYAHRSNLTSNNSVVRSGTISRQSSTNDIRPVGTYPAPLNNQRASNYLHNASLNHFYTDYHSSVPASPAAHHHHHRRFSKMALPNSQSTLLNDANTSNENLSEIGYQQYRKKIAQRTSVPIVTSTSSLKNTDMFYLYQGAKNANYPISTTSSSFQHLNAPNKSGQHTRRHDSSSSTLSAAVTKPKEGVFFAVKNQRVNQMPPLYYVNKNENEQGPSLGQSKESQKRSSLLEQKTDEPRSQR